MFTNCPDSFSDIQIVDNLPGTDHDSVKFSICISAPKSSKCVKELYNYKKADFCAFLEVLSHVPWSQLNFDDDIETAWTCWKDLFFAAVGSNIPKTRWKQSKVKHWFTPDTLHLIWVKRRLYCKMNHNCSDSNKSKYKAICNLVRSNTRQDTVDYIATLSKNCNSTSAKEFVNSVVSLLPHLLCLEILFLMILKRQQHLTSTLTQYYF